ncbi:hypothetical protein M378DRAFT_786433 [Amanita muscaria Koide BX008]|uniref:Actin interacting protein 3 C-terminal domain-containing protein n=1 Tax=Amanita muscaria (strain Koide BX008) TaxID=946122 RepID=A0A0C2TQC9_AMAMK|nr:hypothetical protein M378DRAFT_786433 [Amanita muscaria Koide BX008]
MSHTHRRDNHSVSSTQSSSRSDRSTRQNGHPAVESAVTRLLVSIKQLLESLTQWSQLKVDEMAVSDVYVRLGNDFNAAVTAFAAYNIEMSELITVPDDLRNVLEQCLAEEANAEILDIYLPSVRQIITNLLQGLRGKQSIYRRIVSEHKHRSSGEGDHERSDRTSRSDRDRDRDRTSRRNEGGHRSYASSRIDLDNNSDREAPSRRSTATSVMSVSSRKEQEEPFVGGFAPTLLERHSVPQQPPPPPEYQEQPSNTTEIKQRSLPSPGEQSPSPPPPPPGKPQPQNGLPAPNGSSSSTGDGADSRPSSAPTQPVVPAHVKRFSLVDKPVPPTMIIEPTSPDDDTDRSYTPPADRALPMDPPPAVANSLAALKNADVLERRASKRFSSFNIHKMTGGSSRDRSVRNHPNRRSQAVSSALTPGDLAVLTEVDDEEQEEEESFALLRREGSSRSRRVVSRAATPDKRQVPSPLPTTPARTPEPVAPKLNGVQHEPAGVPTGDPSKITVFLQLGREVKKVKVEKGISFSSLRVLFVDKFSYNPGLENFPAIYIRDPSSGVQYELEDSDEVKERCLLSLNIEPLDQIRQHIDSQISGLSQDIKELKSAVVTSNRAPYPIVTQPLAENTLTPERPTDRQFQTVARRLSRFISNTNAIHGVLESPSLPFIPSQLTGQSLQPQMTGVSVMSEYSTRVVSDLKTQFDEVQNLRRDLGIMRQLYTEFMKQTKDSLGTLRTQTQSVRQLATTNIGGARAYIDSGKSKLDSRSQNLLEEVEKLQDAVENIRDDVIKRHITPKSQYLKNVKKDVDSVAAGIESLREHIKTIKPMWKTTWEKELQNIVEEQQFLTHQEELLHDLSEDHKAVVEIYGHIEKVISIRASASSGVGKNLRKPNFRPVPTEEGHGGLSTVMMELRGAAVDPEKRLKAIEASQKNRQKELSSRTDELHSELSEFVGGRKLRMTGGAEEVERVRQKKSEMTLKAMFTGQSVNSPSSSSVSLGSDFASPTSPQPHH